MTGSPTPYISRHISIDFCLPYSPNGSIHPLSKSQCCWPSMDKTNCLHQQHCGFTCNRSSLWSSVVMLQMKIFPGTKILDSLVLKCEDMKCDCICIHCQMLTTLTIIIMLSRAESDLFDIYIYIWAHRHFYWSGFLRKLKWSKPINLNICLWCATVNVQSITLSNHR